MVLRCAGAPWDVVDEAPARSGEDSQYWLDSTKLRALGWRPEVSLETAVARIVAWARRFPAVAKMPIDYKVTA
jgi:dTDP-glucose 4,6-dehydratase